VKVTIDSSEPLDDALRVLGAVYNVQLAVTGPVLATIDTALPRLTKAAAATKKKPVAGASRTTRGRHTKNTAPPSGKSPSSKELRAWAQANGHHVSGRGRVPSTLMDAYRSTHNR
jgi:hypothetical protein